MKNLGIKPNLLIFNLSVYKHLEDATQFNKVYCSPRMNNTPLNFHPSSQTYVSTIKVPSKCNVSDIVTFLSLQEIIIHGIVVYVDIFILHYLLPSNFPSDIPVSAILCDVHHGKGTITGALDYLYSMDIKNLVLKQTISQNRLWSELGFTVHCMKIHYSGVNLRSSQASLMLRDRSPIPLFYGNFSSSHGFRKYLLKKAIKGGADISIRKVPKSQLDHLLDNTSTVLNPTLNGDINFRLVEAISAGCLVLMDKLSKDAQEILCFKPGVHYLEYTYSSISKLLENLQPSDYNSLASNARLLLTSMIKNSHMGEIILESINSNSPCSINKSNSLCDILPAYELVQDSIYSCSFNIDMLCLLPVFLHSTIAYERFQ